MSTAVKRGIYDKFGEEGLKGGIPLEFGSQTPWTTGYVFHGNPEKVFNEFFGGDNPFSGKNSTLPLASLGKDTAAENTFLGGYVGCFFFILFALLLLLLLLKHVSQASLGVDV